MPCRFVRRASKFSNPLAASRPTCGVPKLGYCRMATSSTAARRTSLVLRLSAELVVVALGVFLGLAADSWREARSDRGRERTYLRALRADVAAALASLNEAGQLDSLYMEQSQATLALLRSDTIPSDESWTERTGLQLAPLALPSGTVDALIQTGDLGLLRSDSLGVAVRGLSASLASNLAYLQDVNSRAGLNVADWALEIERIRIDSDGGISLASLRRSPVIVSGYATHARILLNRLATLDMMRNAFVRVQELLEREEGLE